MIDGYEAKPRVRRPGHFGRFWLGQTLSLTGSQVTVVALPVMAVQLLDAGSVQLGVIAAAAYSPFLLLGLTIGYWVDRLPRRPLMAASSATQALALVALAVAASTHVLTTLLITVLAFVGGCGAAVFDIAYRSFIPSLVPTDGLAVANARLSASESAAEVAGPSAGGLLVQAIGAPLALVVDAVSFVACALTTWSTHATESRPQQHRSFWPDVREGALFTFRNATLRAFAGEAAYYNLVWQVFDTLLVLWAIRTLQMTPFELGLVLAGGGAGALLGSVLTVPVGRRVGSGRTLILCSLLSGASPLALICATQRTAVAVLLAALLVRGIGLTGCNVHVLAIRQRITPDRLLGRTNAAYRMLVTGVMPVGALVAGALGGWLGVGTAARISLVPLCLGSLFLIFSPVRRLR